MHTIKFHVSWKMKVNIGIHTCKREKFCIPQQKEVNGRINIQNKEKHKLYRELLTRNQEKKIALMSREALNTKTTKS